MMAVSSYSKSQAPGVSVRQFFSLVSHFQSQPSSAVRCFCSRRSNETDKLSCIEKPKSSTKTKRAKSMARIINSKAWSSDIESSLSSLSPSLSKTTVLQTLSFIKDPSKASQFFKWTLKMGYIHDSQSYFAMLELLGRARNLNSARNFLFSIEKASHGAVKLEARFFNSLIRNYSGAGLFQESLKLFRTMKSLGISPSVISFNSLLSILLKRGRTSMAKCLYDEMLGTYGVTPDTYTFNTLINGFCMNGMIDEGYRFFREMSRFKCDPDVVTYNTLVDGLCRAGKIGIAQNVVKGMKRKNSDLNPNVVTYTTLIRGFCAKREIDGALDVFQEMVEQGLKPNNVTYNTLVKGLCEVQNFEKIKEVLELGGEVAGFSPDTCTFNILMHAQCDSGNLDEALKIFENMVELKVKPDSATYSVLIRNLCEKRNYDRAETLVDDLLEREILLSDVGCKPLVAAYNPMFEYLCGNGKTGKAERVFRQLMKRGTQDPSTFKTLIMGHCKEGTFESGYELLVLMLRRDFLPDMEIYETLIDGLLQKDKPCFAHKTLEKMLKSSYLPKSSTFHSVLTKLIEKGFSSESACLIQLMIDRKIRQNVNASTYCVKLLFKAGMREKAFQTICLLYDNGYSVKMEDLISNLSKERKFIDTCKLLLYCFERNESFDIHICNEVIIGLCKIKKLSEAFCLYYELVERQDHVRLRLTCQSTLEVSLKASGKMKEAEFVSRRLEKFHLQTGCLKLQTL